MILEIYTTNSAWEIVSYFNEYSREKRTIYTLEEYIENYLYDFCCDFKFGFKHYLNTQLFLNINHEVYDFIFKMALNNNLPLNDVLGFGVSKLSSILEKEVDYLSKIDRDEERSFHAALLRM